MSGTDSPETADSHDDDLPRRKGIYLLPNLFTTATLFGGFYAIISAIGGDFAGAAIAIFVAMAADTLDGRVARLTNTASDFGKEYDSLSDMVTFGLASGVVMYIWALQHLPDNWTHGGKAAWLAAFVYVACTALRLARFNVSAGQASGKSNGVFLGLPSPAGAGLTAGFIWVCTDLGIPGDRVAPIAFVITLIAGGLMVSNVRFYSFKDLNLARRVPFLYVLALVGVFVLVTLDPPKVSFGVFVAYAISGPVISLVRRRARRKRRLAAERSEADS